MLINYLEGLGRMVSNRATGLKGTVIGLGQEGLEDEGLQSQWTSCSPVAVPERHD